MYNAKPTGFGGNNHYMPKPNSDLNHVSFRSTCLFPQLEVNRPHSVGLFYAFIVGVEPPLFIAGLAFIRQNGFEGVMTNISVSFHSNIRYRLLFRVIVYFRFLKTISLSFSIHIRSRQDLGLSALSILEALCVTLRLPWFSSTTF